MALLTIVPRQVLGGPKFTAPSDQLTKGIIGVGGIGKSSYHFTSNKDCRLVAVCDVDRKHLKRRRAGTEEVRRDAGSLQRLPPPDHRPQYRHRAYRHAAALARHHGRRGGQGRQGHLVRETDDAHHRRRRA